MERCIVCGSATHVYWGVCEDCDVQAFNSGGTDEQMRLRGIR